MNSMKNKKRWLGLAVALGCLLPAVAGAVPMVFNRYPVVVTGSGVGKTGLYRHVATQDGNEVDMLATIIAQDNGFDHLFILDGDDMKFDTGGPSNRSVTVRYEFFLRGTNTPVAINSMAWTIEDFDYQTGSFPRREHVRVQGALGYSLNNPTNILVEEESGAALQFTGTQKQDSGQAAGAVTLHFVNVQNLVITYMTTQDPDGGLAGFVHDGDADFNFGNPIFTPSPLQPIYYTYELVNDEEVPVVMAFFNELPSALAFDAAYEPVVASGDMDALVADLATRTNTSGATADDAGTMLRSVLDFTGDNQTATIDEILVPPGTTTFVLKTGVPSDEGTYVNKALTTVLPESGFPEVVMQALATYSRGAAGGPGSSSSPPAGIPAWLGIGQAWSTAAP